MRIHRRRSYLQNAPSIPCNESEGYPARCQLGQSDRCSFYSRIRPISCAVRSILSARCKDGYGVFDTYSGDLVIREGNGSADSVVKVLAQSEGIRLPDPRDIANGTNLDASVDDLVSLSLFFGQGGNEIHQTGNQDLAVGSNQSRH